MPEKGQSNRDYPSEKPKEHGAKSEILVGGTSASEDAEAPDIEPISLPEVPTTIDDVVKQVSSDIDLYNQIKSICLKLTKVGDWLNQDGRPYLMEPGAENIANAWGIDLFDLRVSDQIWLQDDRGRYFMYAAKAKAFCRKLGRYLEDEGTCSQRDKLFGMVAGKLRELHDVDATMIRKKAITNCYNRLIKRTLGLLNVTWDDLKEVGFPVEKITRIEYEKGGKKAEAELTGEVLKRRSEIWTMCMEIALGREDQALEVLAEFSSFPGRRGVVKAKKLTDLRSERWISETHKSVKKALDALRAKTGKGGLFKEEGK